MRQASANGQSGTAQAASALDRLQEAQKRLQQSQSGRAERDVKDALRQAEEIAREQQQIAEGVKGLDTAGDARQERVQQLSERKEQLESKVGRAREAGREDRRRAGQDRARRLAEARRSVDVDAREPAARQDSLFALDDPRRRAGQATPRTSSRRSAATSARCRRRSPTRRRRSAAPSRMRPRARSTRRASWLAGWSRSTSACASAMVSKANRVSRVSKASRVRVSKASRDRVSKASRVRVSKASRVRVSKASRVRVSKASRVRVSRASRVRVSKANRARVSKANRVRVTGPAGPGSARPAGSGSRPAGSAGQQGQGPGRSESEWKSEHRRRDGQGLTFGQAPFTGGGAGDRRPAAMNPEDARQFRGEVQRWTREAEQLRRMLQGEKIDPKEIDAMLRNLRQLSDDRIYKDVEELARLQAQVTDSAKRLEYDLRRKVEGTEGRLLLSGSDEVPEKFRKSVEQYYRSLSKAPEGGKSRGRREAAGEEAVGPSTRWTRVNAPHHHRRPRRPDAGRWRVCAGLLSVPAQIPAGADARDRRQLRRLVHLLPPVLHERPQRVWRPGVVDRLSGGRCQLHDPPRRADQDPGQPGSRRRTQSSRRERGLPRALRVSVCHHRGRRHRAVHRSGGRGAARLPAQGRVSLVGRLLGRQGARELRSRARPRAARARVQVRRPQVRTIRSSG